MQEALAVHINQGLGQVEGPRVEEGLLIDRVLADVYKFIYRFIPI